MRTFIAINFDSEIRREIGDLQNRLRPGCGRLNWVNPDIMHLTIKFLGEIRDQQITPISDALDQLAKQCKPFDVTVEKTGTFPPSGPVRVVWVGITDATGQLTKCQALCEDLIEPLGFARENRKFSPHLTLARNKDPHNSANIRSALAKAKEMPACVQTITGVTFYQSTLTRGGPIYQPLSQHAFSA